jgi:hypothetical protein
MLAGEEWPAARFGTTETDLRLMWELKLHVSPEQWELWKTASWAAPYLATVENVQRLEDLPAYELVDEPAVENVRTMEDLPTYELVDEPTKERTPATQSEDSGHYAFSPDKRKEIVDEYREARNKRYIQNKNTWASHKHGICGKTLLSYEREFPEEKS